MDCAMMKQSFFMGGVTGAFLTILGWKICHGVVFSEELASKVEWSIVQSVEFQYRDGNERRIKIVKVDDYALAGVPVSATGRKIWVMLNSRNPPYYKQLPKGDFSLSKEDLKLILASGVVSSTVENCLESHVVE